MFVFTNACAAMPLAPSAEPALNPNQPNQRIPVPSSVSGSECGGIGCRGQPRRFPITSTMAERGDAGVDVHDRAAGEVERAAAEQPSGRREDPVRDRRVHDDDQIPRNQTHAENCMRSAIAPVINAGVMTANIIWNAENDSGGIGSAPKPVAGTCRDVVQPREVEVADPLPGAAEGERVHDGCPQDAHEAQRRRSSA